MKIRLSFVSNSSSSSFLINDKNQLDKVLNIAEQVFKKFTHSEYHKLYKDTTVDSLIKGFKSGIVGKNNIIKYIRIGIYQDWYDYIDAQNAIKTFNANKSGCATCESFINKKCELKCDFLSENDNKCTYDEPCRSKQYNTNICTKLHISCCYFGFVYDNMIEAKQTLKKINHSQLFKSLYDKYFNIMYYKGYVVDEGHRVVVFKYKKDVFNSEQYNEFNNQLENNINKLIESKYNDMMTMIEVSSDTKDKDQQAIRGCGLLHTIYRKCKKAKIKGCIIENS